MNRKMLLVFLFFILFTSFLFPVFSNQTNQVEAANQNADLNSWSMSQHDPANAGYSSSTAPQSNQTAWTKTIVGATLTNGQPVVSNNIVYVGGDNGAVYALDALTGSTIWSVILDQGNGFVGNLAIDGNDLYCIFASNVYALNIATGSTIWKFPFSGSSSNLIIANGNIYFGASNETIYAINDITGAKLWTVTLGVQTEADSCAFTNNIVYVGSMGAVYALNSATGALIWSYSNSSLSAPTPTIANGLVYFSGLDSSLDGQIYALNADTGDLVWIFLGDNGPGITYGLSVFNGMIYFSMGLGKVYGLNATTGVTVFRIADNFGFSLDYLPPAIANGILYISYASISVITFEITASNVCAFDAYTGDRIWTYNMEKNPATAPVIGDGFLYVGYNNLLVAFGVPVQPPTTSPSPNESPTPMVSPVPSAIPTPVSTTRPTPTSTASKIPTSTTTPSPSQMPSLTPSKTSSTTPSSPLQPIDFWLVTLIVIIVILLASTTLVLNRRKNKREKSN